MEGFDERSYLGARRWKPGDDPYTLYAFNQRESERIPSNRALRDTRNYRYTLTRKPPETCDTAHTRTKTIRVTTRTVYAFLFWFECLCRMLDSVW